MKARRSQLLKSLITSKNVFVKGILLSMFLSMTFVTANAETVPGYGELQIKNFGQANVEVCLSTLKNADILTSEMTYLGTKECQFGDFTLFGITAVTESPEGDKYFVLSCRVNKDASGMVAGPTEISVSQAYFTRYLVLASRRLSDYP